MSVANAPGPLTVSSVNPRYFTVDSIEAANPKLIYLTGSHCNNNFHDGLGPGRQCPPDDPEQFDFETYLDFLSQRGHNFIRLWRWEQFQGYLSPAEVHFCMRPQPWPRTGPGSAKDRKPKFDLSAFDDSYFDRLRSRVAAAGRRGIYVSVMFFEGFSLHLTAPPDNIEGHPFHAANNVNDVSISSIVDYQVLPLHERIRELQEKYVHKVIDTVHDLPNVLYEVANESSGQAADAVTMPDGSRIETPIGDSTSWQYWVIELTKNYERSMGYASHPIGMTFLYPVTDQSKANEPLWNSPADWISPGFDDRPVPGDSRWLLDPPANDGRKVVISDTDHYSPFQSTAVWAWKSFLRGHNPILYDLGIIGGVAPADPDSGTPSFNSLEAARYAMGETRRFTDLVDLATLEPRGDLTSTGYALAHPGHEYLTLKPDEGEPELTLMLSPGSYAARWHDVDSRRTVDADSVTTDHTAAVTFRSPFDPSSPAVLHLASTAR